MSYVRSLLTPKILLFLIWFLLYFCIYYLSFSIVKTNKPTLSSTGQTQGMKTSRPLTLHFILYLALLKKVVEYAYSRRYKHFQQWGNTCFNSSWDSKRTKTKVTEVRCREKNNYRSICYFSTTDSAMDLSITSPVSPLIQITDFRSMIRVIGSSLHNPQIKDQWKQGKPSEPCALPATRGWMLTAYRKVLNQWASELLIGFTRARLAVSHCFQALC